LTADPYVYDGTDVLVNAVGARDREGWLAAEADFTRLRVARLLRTEIAGRYDLAHLQAFHRFIFEGFYDWAGELRSVDIAKTALFCHWRYLASAAHTTFANLGPDLLAATNRKQFVGRLTHHLGEVNALHPFREGNGRAQRAFFAQLGRDAGYRIDWTLVDPERNRQTSHASLVGDLAPLAAILDEIVSPMQEPRR
jgi:cell filamentation protein